MKNYIKKIIEDCLLSVKLRLSKIEDKLAYSDRDYLVVYHWSNDISGDRGDSSLIVSLESGEVFDGEKIKSLQDEVLETIRTQGHPNDPTACVITGFYRLEK